MWYFAKRDTLIQGAYKWSRDKTENYGTKHDLPGLINIPVTPIGYGDAKKFLTQMEGELVPADWRGGITDDQGNVIDYKFGPTLKNGHKTYLFVQVI